MKSLALLHSLFLAHCCGWTNALISDVSAITRLQWTSMGTHIKTMGFVRHLEEDAFVNGRILYADDFTLMTTDGKVTDRVVGLLLGYAEGRLIQARFNLITGFLQTNSSHVLVVDYNNHCLRFVNRFTNLTSPFVGNCTFPGYVDGQYNYARFRNPLAIIKNLNNFRAAIVTDEENKALRSIDFDSGNVTTLINSLPGIPRSAAFDSDDENVFITFANFLGQFSVKTYKFMILTSTQSKVGLDGPFSKASFIYAREIICESRVCLVTDSGSHKLRILDMNNMTMYSVCSSSSSLADALPTNCSLGHPLSILLKSGTLYVGDYKAIRVITERNNLTCPQDISVTGDLLTMSANISLWSGDQMTLGVGRHILNKKLSEKVKCTIHINVLDPRLTERLDIKADYRISCNAVNNFKDVILSFANSRYSQINMISSGYCNKSKETSIQVSCGNNMLSVSWPTDCLIPSNKIEKAALVNGINASLKRNAGTVLDLLVPNHLPPVLIPLLTQDGYPATVHLTPLCSGGLKYVNTTGTCQ